jgi:hypothetical protein
MAKELDANLILTVGLLGVGSYAVYKLFQPAAKDTTTGGLLFGNQTPAMNIGGQLYDATAAGQGSNLVLSGFKSLLEYLKYKNDANTNTTQATNPNPYNTIQAVTSNDYVKSVTPTNSTAYGKEVVKVTSATGKSSNIVVTPNTYYANAGIGFNSQGQGYSSAYVGNKPTNGAPTGANVAALIRANPKFN